MDKSQLNTALLAEANKAYLQLCSDLDYLFNAADKYCALAKNEVVLSKFKYTELTKTFKPSASLIKQLSDVITRWNRGDPRVLNREVVEVEILNELWIHFSVVASFFIQEGLVLYPFNLTKTNICLLSLSRVNRAFD